jgi:hypothetical protein
MENKNIWDHNASASESVPEGSNKPKGDMSIVLYNLLALAFYTVICAIIGNGGAVIDAFLIGIHFFTCLILTMINGKWVWILSGFLVLLIGFSTCAGILWRLM